MNLSALLDGLAVARTVAAMLGQSEIVAAITVVEMNADIVGEVVTAIEAKAVDKAAVLEAFKRAMTAASDAVMKKELGG